MSGGQSVDSDSSDDSEDRVVNNEFFTIESEDTEDYDSDVADDTDEDPDFGPPNFDQISSDEDEQPSTSTGRPRGKPPRPSPSTSSQGGSRPRRRRSTPVNVDGTIYNVYSAIGEEDAVAG